MKLSEFLNVLNGYDENLVCEFIIRPTPNYPLLNCISYPIQYTKRYEDSVYICNDMNSDLDVMTVGDIKKKLKLVPSFSYNDFKTGSQNVRFDIIGYNYIESTTLSINPEIKDIFITNDPNQLQINIILRQRVVS